jgi:hypothetical protein
MAFCKIKVTTHYIFASNYVCKTFSVHLSKHYVNFIILICDVFMMISTLCPDRCCALVEVTECDTASCTYVHFN